ncbi:MAG: ferritin-like domain-containing protein [Bacillota bacterium]
MTEEMNSLQDLMLDTLRDLYDAEMLILREGPSMANAVTSPELQDALVQHLKETEGQVHRLEQIFKKMGEEPGGKQCKGMAGILAENQELLKQKADPDVQDVGLILGQQKIEHYEIASYGTAVTFAKLLGDEESAKLLSQTLNEEERVDKRLTNIANSKVNPEAVEGAGSESSAEETENE